MRDKNAIQESQMLRLVDGGVDFEELRKEKKLPFNNQPWQRLDRSSSAVAELKKDIFDVEQEEDGDVTKAARLEDLQKKLRIAETSKIENEKAAQTASKNKSTSQVHNKAKWAEEEVEGLKEQLKNEFDLTEEGRSKLQELLKTAEDKAKTAKEAAKTKSEKMSKSDVHNTAKRAKKEVEGLKDQLKKEVDLTEEGRSKLQELLKTAEDYAKTAKEAATLGSLKKSVGAMRRSYDKEKNKTPDNIPLGEVIHKITQDFKKKEFDKTVATEATFVQAQADRDTLVSSLAGELSNLPDADEHKQNTLQQLLKVKSVLKTIAESLTTKERKKLSRKRASALKEEISNTIKKAKNSA